MVQSTPPPRFSWYANGKPIQQSQRFKVTYDETGLITLIIFNAQPQDSGEYEFVAANEMGEISCKTILNIQRKYLSLNPTFNITEINIQTYKSN